MYDPHTQYQEQSHRYFSQDEQPYRSNDYPYQHTGYRESINPEPVIEEPYEEPQPKHPVMLLAWLDSIDTESAQGGN